MLRLRVQGLPAEVRDFCDGLEGTGCVLSRSLPYSNRGTSRYVRVYLDVDAPVVDRDGGDYSSLSLEGGDE